MSDQPTPTTTGEQDIEARITDYLSAGGLFNPEMMEHEKVRDLLLDCRAALAAERDKWIGHGGALAGAAVDEIKQLRDQLAAERVKGDAAIESLRHFDKQLAAEREKSRQAGAANITTNEMLTKVRHERNEVQKQLAAALEALKAISTGYRMGRAKVVSDTAIAKIGGKP